MRTIARETVFKILFSTQFSEQNDELKQALYKSDKLDKQDIEYCENILASIQEHKDELLSFLNTASHSFPESHIFPADKSILLIAMAELKYFDDIPSKVSINEAANIASKYSSEKSATFISGILSRLV